MRKNLVIAGLFALAALAFTACKEQTRTEMLTSGNWKLAAQIVDPAFPISLTQTTTDYYKDVLKDCQKDDYLTFYDDFNMVRNEGATVCSGASQTSSGDWTFKTGDTKLDITIDGNTVEYTVVSMDDEKLVVTNVLDLAIAKFTITSTFVRP